MRNLNKLLSPLLPTSLRIPPSGTITVPIGDKRMKLCGNQTNYSTTFLFWNGSKNFEYSEIFIDLIKKVHCFYDIGANVGYFSLLANLENPAVRVVAFEPARGPFHYLERNIAINGFPNIEAEHMAISHVDGEIEFHEIQNAKYPWIEYDLAGSGNTGSRTVGRKFTKIAVKTMTLDAYVDSTGCENIDLIKIDTEGSENLILEHAANTISKHKPIIICETLFGEIEAELDRIMGNYGYQFYNHIEGQGLKLVETIRREKDDGVRNCFFIHKSKLHLLQDHLI